MNRGGRTARSSASQALGANDPRLRRNAQAGATDNDIGDGLELDRDGRVRVALDPYGALYYKPDGTIALRVDGVSLIVSPGSPTALRAGETLASKVIDDSGTTSNVADSIRRIIAALSTINATIATLGGGANAVDVTVDFGSSFTQYATATVTGETWVTASSVIAATVKAEDGKGMETSLFDFRPVVSDLVAGDGFTLTVFTPVKAKGTYTFSCVGV